MERITTLASRVAAKAASHRRAGLAAALTSAAITCSLLGASSAEASTSIGPQQMYCSTGSITAGVPQYVPVSGTDQIRWQPLLQRLLNNGTWQSYSWGYIQTFDTSPYGGLSLDNEHWQVPANQIFRVVNYYSVNGAAATYKFSYTNVNQAQGSPYECHS